MRWLSWGVFALGLVMMVVSYNSEARVNAALELREKALVAKYHPSFVKVCAFLGVKEPDNSKSVEGMLDTIDGLAKGFTK